MPTVTIKPEQLASMVDREYRKVARAMKTAAKRAARRFVALIVQTIDEMGITDRGGYKASWKVGADAIGNVIVFSDCPYAGVIELGARPHGVSAEGRENIEQWAIRKLGVDEREAKSIAFLVSRKLQEEGQQPRYVVRDLLPEARVFFAEEMVRILNSRAEAAS